jgi:acetylornithine deacetylase/succinyl-diaminopimelate desuccinylase-like protein
VYGKYAQIVPLAPFAAPAALVAAGKPLISCGLERPASSIFGPDEHVPLADVESHARLIAELVHRMAV